MDHPQKTLAPVSHLEQCHLRQRSFRQRQARLFSPRSLRQLFASRGVEPGDTVVTYCTVGMRASHLYFVGRLLDYPDATITALSEHHATVQWPQGLRCRAAATCSGWSPTMCA